MQEALSLYRDMGDKRGEAKTLNNIGKMQLHSGYHRDALESFQDALVIFGQIGGTQGQAVVYHNIGTVYQYKGSYERVSPRTAEPWPSTVTWAICRTKRKCSTRSARSTSPRNASMRR